MSMAYFAPDDKLCRPTATFLALVSAMFYNKNMINMKRIRLVVFPAVALLHVVLIFFLVFTMNTIASETEPVADIMKLVDVQEETPPPPPPPEEEPPPSEQNTVEAVAANMKAVDVVPQQTVVPSTPRLVVQTQEIEYLPAHKISKPPQFSTQVRSQLVYPPIAQRSGVEGMVILDMFIDAQGNIQRIEVLKEDPPGRGFAEAALNAFRGVKATPAEANGKAVGTRYRYPIRFTIKKNR
ncbi:MAG: energy transducer TonB [Treponema sp.]|nr:energy transducer TonB [Treponema sp.]